MSLNFLSSLALILSFSSTALAVGEVREFDSENLKKVSVENLSGRTRISVATDKKVAVEIKRNTFSDNCTLVTEKKGDTLVLQIKKTGIFTSCSVDFDIQVPKIVDLDVSVGSGNVDVKGVEGTLDFKVGSGQIAAEGSFPKVEGMAGSGNIDIKGLTGGGELKTGSGDIKVTFAGNSPKGALALKTGSGDAELHFPKTAKVSTEFEAGSGQLSNDLKDSPSAEFKVSMSAGSGDLKIKTF